MFDTDYQAPKREKVPTLNQYLKTLPKNTKKLEQSFIVEMVWLPSKFDNVTLQTHAFRLILNDSHPLYSEIVNYFGEDKVFEELRQFRIKITDRDTKAFTLSAIEGKTVGWKRVGENGYRVIDN